MAGNLRNILEDFNGFLLYMSFHFQGQVKVPPLCKFCKEILGGNSTSGRLKQTSNSVWHKGGGGYLFQPEESHIKYIHRIFYVRLQCKESEGQ